MNTLGIYPKGSKILLVGPYPPPLGGVSVYVKRLKKLLDKRGHQTDVFFTSKKYKSKMKNSIKLFLLFYRNNYDIINIHGYFRAYILMIFLGKYIKKYDIFYTGHNPRIFDNKNKFTRYFIKKFIEKLDYLILVADHVLENLKENNVKLPSKLIVQHAFLPPPFEEEDRIIRSYSLETNNFLSKQKPLIIANAWQIKFYQNMDLYGLDLCVELTCRLKKSFPKIGLLFALANNHVNADYIRKIKNRINILGIKDNFHFMTGQKELWPLFKKADLSIRPTATDGDAISIRESLHFNCPVVASDAVQRPKNTTIFKSRDVDDLYLQVSKILDSDKIELQNSICVSVNNC